MNRHRESTNGKREDQSGVPVVRWGRWLSKRRGVILTPFFVLCLLVAHQEWTVGAGRIETVAAWLLVVMGTALRLWASSYHEISGGLITAGPYSAIRHPLYLSNFLLGLGVVVATGVPWLLPVYGVGFAIVHVPIARSEEIHLVEQYGEAYEVYRRSVPAIVPWRRYSGVRQGRWSREKWRKGAEWQKVVGYGVGLGVVEWLRRLRVPLDVRVGKMTTAWWYRVFAAGWWAIVGLCLVSGGLWWGRRTNRLSLRSMQAVVASLVVLVAAAVATTSQRLDLRWARAVASAPSADGKGKPAALPVAQEGVSATDAARIVAAGSGAPVTRGETVTFVSSADEEGFPSFPADAGEGVPGRPARRRVVLASASPVARWMRDHAELVVGAATFLVAGLIEQEDSERSVSTMQPHDLEEVGQAAVIGTAIAALAKQWWLGSRAALTDAASSEDRPRSEVSPYFKADRQEAGIVIRYRF